MLRISRNYMQIAVLAGLCTSATPCFGLPFVMGDVFVGAGGGQVFEYTPTGTLVQKLSSGNTSSETTGMAFDTSGALYSTNFSVGQIVKYDNNGVKIGTFGSGFVTPESILFDLSGNAFVGDAGTNLIKKFNSAGTLLNSTTVPIERGTDWIDLAADQKTVYYTSESGIVHRADTSTNTVLSNFATPGGTSFALRLLSDGGALVAHTSNVLRLDSTGAITKTYTGFTGSSELFALNLDPDGKSFWTGDIGGSTNVYRVDIATGSIITNFKASKDGASEVAGLAVFGEITQGGPTTGTPEPATFALTGLGLLGALLVGRRKLHSN